MIAYKLVRKTRTGSLHPLFINRNMTYEIGQTCIAENHKKAGFSERPGFHCVPLPTAPHLKMNLSSGEKRVWVRVSVNGYEMHNNVVHKDSLWILANEMTVKKELSSEDVKLILESNKLTEI